MVCLHQARRRACDTKQCGGSHEHAFFVDGSNFEVAQNGSGRPNTASLADQPVQRMYSQLDSLTLLWAG